MSSLTTTHPIGQALGFVRGPTPRAAASLAATLRLLLEALREGRDAASAYQRLTRQGVPHDKAVRAIFETHYRAH